MEKFCLLPAVLDERINRRVDEMVDQGLLKELSDFHVDYNVQRLENKFVLFH